MYLILLKTDVLDIFLPYCFKNRLHINAYMSWDSGVHRI